MAEALPVPSRLPLFPLQMVLFPGTRLPLRIFEVRYLDMIGRCHREGQPFGVVGITEGHEVQQPAGPTGDGYAHEAFHAVGTLAVIEQLQRPQPGLLMIECRATQRLRVRSHERLKHGLWVAEAELLPDDPPIEPPDDLEHTVLTLQALLHELKADADGATHFDDCGWVANRWAQLLPLPAGTKQRLLETDSPLLRLELVADLLDTLRQREPPPQR